MCRIFSSISICLNLQGTFELQAYSNYLLYWLIEDLNCCFSESICKEDGKSTCDIIGVRRLKHESAATGRSKKSSQDSSKQDKNKQNTVDVKSWKPLLLVIPLRLGLTEINSVYVQSLKV